MASSKLLFVPALLLLLSISENGVNAGGRAKVSFGPGKSPAGRAFQGTIWQGNQAEGLFLKPSAVLNARRLQEIGFETDSDDELFGQPDNEDLPEPRRVVGPLPLETDVILEDDEDYDTSQGGGTLAHMLDKVLEKEFPDEELQKGRLLQAGSIPE
jgi:hypothetical protein